MKHNIIKKIWLLACLLVAGSPAALGQWQTQSFDLAPGWNAIYSHVDTTHSGIAALASGTPVEEVWMWQPPVSTAQYVTTPDVPSDAKSRWASWKSVLGDNTSVLKRMPGNSAYLVKLGGSVNYTWSVKGKPVPPSYQWTTTGLNFFGVPSVSSNPKSLEDYFGFAGYLLQNTKIFAYGGGDISATNPGEVYGLRTTLAKRGQAFWMDAGTQFNRYFGPFSVKLQSVEGAHLGDQLSAYRLRLRNMTSTDLTVSLAGVDSETVPSGETAIAAAAPVLVRGALDTATLVYAHAVLADGTQSWTLKPAGTIGSEVEVVVGLDRTTMTGAAGTLYASLLRFTDSLGHSQVDIPVSGKVGSSEGLWIGNAGISQVRHSLETDTTTFGNVSSAYPLRLIMHKEKLSGVTVVPNDITVGAGVTAGAAVTQGTGVSVTVAATPRAYTTGEALTFSGGGVLTLTADAAAGVTALTGDLTVADIADTETVGTAVAQGAGVSVPVAGLPRAYSSGNQIVFSGGGVLTLTADAPSGATTLTGDLAGADIADTETTSTGATQGAGVSVAVTSIPRPLYAGEAIVFSGGGVLTLTANAPANSVVLTGTLTGADIAQDETGGANRVKLLQRVFVGTLASGINGVAVKQSLLDATKLETTQRISCVHLPVSEDNLPWVCGGDLVSGQTVTVAVDVGYNDQTSNPFVHTYHPDHDNLTADFKTVQPVGRESYRIRREITLTFETAGERVHLADPDGEPVVWSLRGDHDAVRFGHERSGKRKELRDERLFYPESDQ